jgi:IS30 family transposase
VIGRAFGKPHNSIHGFSSQHGGIVPPVRRRSLLVLTAVEREDISRGLASGSSIRDIAKGLERAASTVSREVARHGGRPEYRAQEADHQAWESALRPKRCLLAIHVKLRKLVASKLILDWSPEQISGWLKERTKTPTACCVNTCPREPTFPATRNPSWTRSRCV